MAGPVAGHGPGRAGTMTQGLRVGFVDNVTVTVTATVARGCDGRPAARMSAGRARRQHRDSHESP
jgi:hypothetical protein